MDFINLLMTIGREVRYRGRKREDFLKGRHYMSINFESRGKKKVNQTDSSPWL